MASTSTLNVYNRALENNIEFINKLVGEGPVISAVVKGNAYGHGISQVIESLERNGINHFSVYSSPEAKEALKNLSPGSTLMIMGFVCEDDYDWIIRNGVQFYTSNLYELNKAIEKAAEINTRARIHLDIETGMNRTGMVYKELKKAIPLIKSNQDRIEIIGTASHFAGAESVANYARIKRQFAMYRKRLKFLSENGIDPGIRHIASSAATIVYPETRLDLVRVGIMLYGYWPTRETFIHYNYRKKDKSDPLKRALKWYSQVVSIKEIQEGGFIGYGLSYQAQFPMRIMIIPVGYCNGYSRSLSNQGRVLVKGHNAPVIGSVNMNMIICDITNIEDVNIGDEVVLIGNQGEKEISFSSFAEMNNSLNYEILARLPQNIERKLIYS
jgi:alanine racemase